MNSKQYAKAATRTDKLSAELLAAGIVPQNIASVAIGLEIAVDVAVVWASVDAVVAAHDPATPNAAETQVTTDGGLVQQFLAQADSAIANWATLTATQKDTALLRCLQALRAIARRYS